MSTESFAPGALTRKKTPTNTHMRKQYEEKQQILNELEAEEDKLASARDARME